VTLYQLTSSLRDWAATIRKWKEFKHRTGQWPLLSILASTLHTASYLVGGAFLIWYSEKQHWSESRFIVILLAGFLPYVFVWAWLQNKIYLGELRRSGLPAQSNSDFEPSLGAKHHRTKVETEKNSRKRARGWDQLADASWHVDHAIFIIFVVFLAATMFAKALFWLFGW
jgi:hypothetical protein